LVEASAVAGAGLAFHRRAGVQRTMKAAQGVNATGDSAQFSLQNGKPFNIA
jgi:hypothetical protein